MMIVASRISLRNGGARITCPQLSGRDSNPAWPNVFTGHFVATRLIRGQNVPTYMISPAANFALPRPKPGLPPGIVSGAGHGADADASRAGFDEDPTGFLA
jgi:hypothetical protein